MEKTDPMHGVKPIYVVQERDIDLLLLEELHVCPDFVAWFGNCVGFQRAVFSNAWYSFSSADGETDLLLRVLSGNERVGILIENKIAAPEQPQQDERYHRRGSEGVRDGCFDRYVTCICAPREYLDALTPESSYLYRVSYEDIADWFTGQIDPRSAWRSFFIKAAIAQVRRGYIKQVNDLVTRFHLAYHERLCRTQSNLVMSPPTPKGRGGTWIIVWVSGWPKNVHLNHKLSRGSVELGFERHTRNQLMELANSWPENVRPITTGRYGSLAITVSPVDVTKPFDIQVTAVDQALAAMQTLIPYARLIEQLPG